MPIAPTEPARSMERDVHADHVADEIFAVAFRASPVPMIVTDNALPDNPIVSINNAFESLTGYDAAHAVGKNCRFLQGPATNRHAVERIVEAIASHVPITTDLINYRRDGSAFWNRLSVSPVVDQNGGIRFFTASLIDVTAERERRLEFDTDQQLLSAEADQTHATMADTARRLQLSLVADEFGSWSRDLTTNRLDASGGCKALFGLPADAPFTHEDFERYVLAEDIDRLVTAVTRSEREGVPFDIEYRIKRPDGEIRWIAARGEMLRRRDGTPLSIHGFLSDITARKNADEHRQLVANELGHRIRNILSIIGAVIAQSLRGAQSLEEAQTTIEGRIAALAAAQDELIRASDAGARIDQVVARVLAPFDPEHRRIVCSGSSTMIDADRARALAMTLHELATNAVKYGALSNEHGSVSLTWRLQESDATVLDVAWRERGGPPMSPPTRRGFGSRLITGVLAPFTAEPPEFAYEAQGLIFTAALRLPVVVDQAH